MLKFDYRSPYKRFDLSDTYIILGVFLIGFVLALILANYYQVKRQKIDQISQKFQEFKGEYEQVEKRLKKYIKWKYRIKFAEKIYYIFLLSLGLLFYKSPALLAFAFTENPHIFIPLFCCLILFFHYIAQLLDSKEQEQQKKHTKLKEKIKDTKR